MPWFVGGLLVALAFLVCVLVVIGMSALLCLHPLTFAQASGVIIFVFGLINLMACAKGLGDVLVD